MDVNALIARWKARREETENRFRKHFPETDDMLAIVLRGHLLVEEFLDRLNRHCFHFPEYYDKAELTFYQKLMIARAQVLVPHADPDHFFAPITKLNKLRNTLAHNLESPKLRGKVEEFLESVEARYPSDSPILQEAAENTIESRLRSAIFYILGQMHVLDHVVEFIEKTRAYGSAGDTTSGAPSSNTESEGEVRGPSDAKGAMDAGRSEKGSERPADGSGRE